MIIRLYLVVSNAMFGKSMFDCGHVQLIPVACITLVNVTEVFTVNGIVH